ncbi:MAG: FAD-dependent oxidoreductase [Actinomycetota bacterium]|nr:FAD-dependent oxidoreductase [Actinomycetota bacterium]
MKLNNLFSPINLGKLELKNRIVFAPIGIGAYNDDETVNSTYFPFIQERAKETALIITQGTRPSLKYGGVKIIGTYDDKFIPSLSKFAESAHRNGAKIFIQSVIIGGNDPLGGYAPSVLDLPLYKDKWGRGNMNLPKELKIHEIKEIIEEFAQGARRSREAGFDGIEIHGAYGYLISEFICPATNIRTDEYGGSFENRMRFPIEIIKRIKEVCGDDFPIGFKFNAYQDIKPEGIDEELGVKIAQRIAKEGVVYLHEVSMGEDVMLMALSKYPSMPTMYQPGNTTVLLAQNLKKHIKSIPVVAAGGISKPDEAEEIIRSGKADMVAVGRALLADPHWSYKAKKQMRIIPCIKCLVCHNEVVKRSKVAVCSVNPFLCKETEIPLVKTKKPKKIVVIGAGPAGITAAITASKRGHTVILYEKQKEIGGQLLLASKPDFKYEFDNLVNYFKEDLFDSKVKLMLNQEAFPEVVRKESPDVLIFAAGAEPIIPDVKGINNTNVISAVDFLRNGKELKNNNVIVVGGGEVGCEIALLVKRKGNSVTIVEALNELMLLEEIKYHTMVLERMLKQEDVKIYTNSKVAEISDDFVEITDSASKTIRLPLDFVIFSVGFKIPKQKINIFKDLCKEFYAIGDSKKPDRIREAVYEGSRIGRLI